MNDLAVDLAFVGLFVAAAYVCLVVIRDWKEPKP